jgi:threonine/homoserine/homoserine lactone efflux protein
MPAELLAFLGLSVVVIVTPGPDTALTIRNTIAGGRTAGLATALGVASGQAIWTLAAAAGVAALLVASEPAFLALKFAGAAYLVFLGLQTLAGAVRPRRAESDHGGGDERPRPAVAGSRARRLRAGPALRQGLISDLANPKMAIFFTSLLPQFTPASGPAFPVLLALGLIFCAMTLAWLALYAAAIDRLGDLLRRTRVRRAIDAAMGTLLVALGARLAVEERR